MKKQLLLFIIFIFQVGYAQIPAGTFVFTNGGGAGLKNLWNNSFNWSIADGLGGFITSGTPPTPTDNVLIDISSILVSGPVIGGVSSNSVIIIDDVASCKTFSLLNTTPNKGLLFTTTNAALNVNGHFDLSGPTSFSVNRAYGYLYGKLNFLGTSTSPFNIKTNNNNIELFDINISGSYILQDNFNQTPIVFTNAQTNFNITGSSPNFNTNNKSIRTTVFYIKNDVVSPVLDFQNSNIKSCFFQVEGSPTTYTYNTSLANIQLTDTLGAFNSGFIRYNFNTGISSFSVNTINCSSTTKALINAGYTHVFTNSLTTNCNTEFGNYVNGTQVGIEATNFIITKSALISGYTNAYSPYPFKCTSIIVPGTCDKQVTFVSSTSYAYNMNIQNANTLNYTNWGDINILGPGSIVANNSSDLGGNMGSITINISAPKRWLGAEALLLMIGMIH